MKYFVYIIESLKDGSYYVGSTQNLSEIMERHNQGRSTYTTLNGIDYSGNLTMVLPLCFL